MTRRRAALAAVAILALAACDEDEEITNRTFKRYGALGASDAWGVGADPRENGYVWLIEDWLHTRYDDVPTWNAGIPGVTADEILVLEVPLVIAHDPGAVTLWTGINDITSGRSVIAFDGDLQDILDALGRETRAQVYVANIPDISRLPKYLLDPDPDVTPARVAAFNAVIGSRAQPRGATIVDLASTPLATDPRYVAGDGFHPNNAGHRLIADAFIAAMAGTLAPSRLTAPPLLRRLP